MRHGLKILPALWESTSFGGVPVIACPFCSSARYAKAFGLLVCRGRPFLTLVQLLLTICLTPVRVRAAPEHVPARCIAVRQRVPSNRGVRK